VYTISTFANDTSGNIAAECRFTINVFPAPKPTTILVTEASASTSAVGGTAGGVAAGLILVILIVVWVGYKRQQRRISTLEQQYGSFEMSDEAVLARAQVHYRR
jgi:hypothetical protein